MVKLDEIERQLRKVPIEEVLKKFDWKDFEEIVSEIFRNNDFTVKQNFRFRVKKRYEIDVLAIKQNLIFCVDCKKWSAGRYKKSAIKTAVSEQEKRTEMLRKFLENNPIATEMLKIGKNPRFQSLITTLMEEDVIQNKKTLIVPIFKLNSFLLELESYL
jgi:Holliday junction resolvase-like predicted endonuclease